MGMGMKEKQFEKKMSNKAPWGEMTKMLRNIPVEHMATSQFVCLFCVQRTLKTALIAVSTAFWVAYLPWRTVRAAVLITTSSTGQSLLVSPCHRCGS